MEDSSIINTYGNIQVTAPYKLLALTKLKVEKKINDHGRIFFTGIISDEYKEKYIEISDYKKEIEVNLVKNGAIESCIFKGTVINVEIKMVRDVYFIQVEGISYSYEMDITLKKRSFQNVAMSYSELIKNVIKDYEGSNFIDMVTNNQSLKKFKTQYMETDWNFLKRIASEFNTGLVVESAQDKSKFWFGIPEGRELGELESFNYTIRKDISDYRNCSENYICGIEEKDFIYYGIKDDNYFNIGDSVSFKSKRLIVSNVTIEIKEGILEYEYTLATENGMRCNPIYNENLVGVSAEGKVIDVSGEQVRLKLNMDNEQNKEEANWFYYSTFYSNIGWYCMPELDDNVILYFPSNKEYEAFVISSLRKKDKSGDKIDNPEVKYLRTKGNKEVMISKDEMVLTGKDEKVVIRLNDTSGIQINSDSTINIEAEGGLNISAANIEITSRKELYMKCNESCIKMDGETHISGTVVKIR